MNLSRLFFFVSPNFEVVQQYKVKTDPSNNYLSIYLPIYLSIYLYTYISKLPRNVATVRLLHPWSEDSQGQETFLVPSADNIKPATLTPSAQTPNPPNRHKARRFSHRKTEWWAIYM